MLATDGRLQPEAPATIRAIDVCLSMRVNKVKPSRMQAAQDLSKLILQNLAKNIEVTFVTLAAAGTEVTALLALLSAALALGLAAGVLSLVWFRRVV